MQLPKDVLKRIEENCVLKLDFDKTCYMHKRLIIFSIYQSN